jgi:RNase H-fold protein (predicted Holliday junction resolvase)
MYLGFDPGTHKCGVAVVDGQGNILYRRVITPGEGLAIAQKLCSDYGVTTIILGNQTGSASWQTLFRINFPDLALHTVDETYSSQEARLRYWDFYPAGWQVILPRGLRIPDQPYDDIVAVILIERYVAECP